MDLKISYSYSLFLYLFYSKAYYTLHFSLRGFLSFQVILNLLTLVAKMPKIDTKTQKFKKFCVVCNWPREHFFSDSGVVTAWLGPSLIAPGKHFVKSFMMLLTIHSLSGQFFCSFLHPGFYSKIKLHH